FYTGTPGETPDTAKELPTNYRASSRPYRHLYDVPSLEGSDVYGFILSREALTKREIQQIEADYWARILTRSIADAPGAQSHTMHARGTPSPSPASSGISSCN